MSCRKEKERLEKLIAELLVCQDLEESLSKGEALLKNYQTFLKKLRATPFLLKIYKNGQEKPYTIGQENN